MSNHNRLTSLGITILIVTSVFIGCAKEKVTDIDGNIYETVKIGDQIWMAENLKVTHYRDGTPIPNVKAGDVWMELSTGAYCIYNENTSNEKDNYGVLYNWYAVNGDTDGDGDKDKDKEIAPEGWHVPTDEEWNELETYLSDNGHARAEGLALKSTIGWFENGNGTDDYGFTVLPSGYRGQTEGYIGMGYAGYFWSTTENYNSRGALPRLLAYDGRRVIQYEYGLNSANGFSIRLLRD